MRSWILSEVVVENMGGILGRGLYRFHKGINYIRGPNATNKSSILRSVVWCITGGWGLTEKYELKTGDRAELDTLLHKGADKGSVELTITSEDENAKIRIKREIIRIRGRPRLGSCSVTKITREGEQVLAEYDLEDIRSAIESELGFTDIEQAFYIAFNGENDPLLVNLMEGAPLRQYISNASGAWVFDAAEPRIKKLVGDLKDDYTRNLKEAEKRASAKGELESLEKTIERHVREIEENNEELKSLETQITETLRKVEELNKIEEGIENIQRNIESKTYRLNEVTSSIEHKQEELEAKRIELEQVKRLLDEGENNLRQLEGNIANMRKDIGEISALIMEYQKRIRDIEGEIITLRTDRDILRKLAELDEEIGKLKVQIESYTLELEKLKPNLKSLDSTLDEISRELESKKGLLKGWDSIVRWVEESREACPICDRPWDVEMQDESLKKLEPKREGIHEEIEKLEPEIEDLRRKKSGIEDEIKRIEIEKIRLEGSRDSIIKEYLKLKAKAPSRTLDDIEFSISNLEREMKQKREMLNKYITDHEKLSSKLEEAKAKSTKLTSKNIELKTTINHIEGYIGTIERDLNEMIKEKEALSSTIGKLEIQLSSLKTSYNKEKCEKLKEDLDRIKTKRDKLAGRIEGLEEELTRDHERVSELKGPAREYDEYKVKADLYGSASGLATIILDIVREVSKDLREEVRDAINGYMSLMIDKLGFEGYNYVKLSEDYKFEIMKNGMLFDLTTLSKGELNALGIAVKFAMADYSRSLPTLLCYDDCLYLDPRRQEALLKHLNELGINNIIVTERTETGPLEII